MEKTTMQKITGKELYQIRFVHMDNVAVTYITPRTIFGDAFGGGGEGLYYHISNWFSQTTLEYISIIARGDSGPIRRQG